MLLAPCAFLQDNHETGVDKDFQLDRTVHAGALQLYRHYFPYPLTKVYTHCQSDNVVFNDVEKLDLHIKYSVLPQIAGEDGTFLIVETVQTGSLT